jgi:hypothetical protein
MYQTTKILPNVHLKRKNCQKIPIGLKMQISTFSIPRPSKIYPNWYLWFENIPSGNPVVDPLSFAAKIFGTEKDEKKN